MFGRLPFFRRTLTPTVDQWSVIAKMHERLVDEKTEASKSSQQKSKEEPLRSMIQRLPGAGKTMAITLLVEYFESVPGWSRRQDFACIASMNTMSALIGGSTIHSFGEVPIGDDQATTRRNQRWDKPDVRTMFIKCENMRVLIIDAGSSSRTSAQQN